MKTSTHPLGFDREQSWSFENGFYLTSEVSRVHKLLAHYELYKSICHLPGQIIECGVYKGASLLRFATFREALESPYSRKIIGFDAFGKFPPSEGEHDKAFIRKFEEAGGNGLSKREIEDVLAYKKLSNIELIEGNICNTVPEYVNQHPELKIALLHIDVDVYEPSKIILEKLFSRVVSGGLVVLDDYGTVEGETRAVDEFNTLNVEKLPISHVPSFIRIP